MTLTELRAHLSDLLAEIPGEVKVYVGPGDFLSGERHFVVRVTVGEPGEDAEERLDALLGNGDGSVKAALEQSREIAGVLKHSGYRLYPQPEGKHLLGSEWTVNVIV